MKDDVAREVGRCSASLVKEGVAREGARRS